MQTEVKISDVLHLAADKYLAKDYEEEQVNCWIKSHFSCDAIDSAVDYLTSHNKDKHGSIRVRIIQGLKAMGCETNSCLQFSELEQLQESGYRYNCTPKSQAARYFWLKWAALMAEEQGE